MTQRSADLPELDQARAALALLRRGETEDTAGEVFISSAGGSAVLPPSIAALLVDALRLVAGGQDCLVRQVVPGASDRPRCAGCGEPVELDDADDAESWIHAFDANDRGDHTAWLDE